MGNEIERQKYRHLLLLIKCFNFFFYRTEILKYKPTLHIFANRTNLPTNQNLRRE